MKALITGVNGFVGGHLSSFLLSKGFEVFGTDRSSNGVTEGVKVFSVDVTDTDGINNLLKKVRPDFIFHLAAVSSVKTCKDNPELTEKVNIGGTKNLLRACVNNGLNPKVLITSSAHVYGIPDHVPIDESHHINPVNEYGKSKLEQERVSLGFFKEQGIKVIISRSFNHIGPNQTTGFVCSDFAKQIAEIEKGLKKPEISVGDLSSKRDFTDVRDIVKAYVLLLEKGKVGDIYNIGSGRGYSIKEILDKLVALSESDINIVEDKSLFRSHEIPILVANNKKFTSLTGWKPEIGIDKSLKDILIYWRSVIN